MDARAEYVIRIPVAALHPRRGSPRSSRPEPITRALRDVLMVLSAEPPLLRPGRFVLQVRAGGVYHRLRVEVPDLRDMPRLDATPALSGDPARDAPDGDAEDIAERRPERGGWGGVRRLADGLWEITPYAPDAEGW